MRENMADQTLVGLTDYLDTGRQVYNESIANFYNTKQASVPNINGLLKMLYNPEGKTKILGIVNGEWLTFAYEDPISTDILYYDEATNMVYLKRDLIAKNGTFDNLTVDSETATSIRSKTGRFDEITVDILNVVNRVNQTTTTELVVEDSTILLNSNLTSGDPDAANYMYAGLIINRGSYEQATLRWDEAKNRWILDIPSDEVSSNKTIELFGITDDALRKIDLTNSSGFYFSSESAAKNPGIYITHEEFWSGIYWDNDSQKYCVKDGDSNFELFGIDLINPGRKAVLNNSTGIEVYNTSSSFAGLDLIHLDVNGRETSRGSIVYDHNSDRLVASTVEKTFELKDIDEFDPFGDSWYYTTDLLKNNKTIVLPSSKPIYNTDEGLLMVYLNGVHLAPDMYTVMDGNKVILNTPVSEDTTVTIYHHVFMSENYRLPLKSLPTYITGVTGKKVYASHSKGAITGELQCLVIKNGLILAEVGEDGLGDYTIDRITETTSEVTFVEPLIETDRVIVYPLLSPNIFVKGSTALVFDTYLENPDTATDTGTAYILFRRGSLPAAGIRWNEDTNNLEVDNGTGIWEALVSSSSKFDTERYVIDSSTDTLSISDLLLRNSLIPSPDLQVSVFKNGFHQDNPTDYTLDNFNIVFESDLVAGDIVTVYVGKAFIKSHNYLVSQKDVQVAQGDTTLLEFSQGFLYEPGTDALNIFVNGILTHKDIDYTELDEKSVRFNYKLEKGTVIQAFAPRITDVMRFSKKTFEFTNYDVENYLSSSLADCSIVVNRGTASPAILKWDEVRDAWYLSNGDGTLKKILASNDEDNKLTQFKEYSGITGLNLSISDMVGAPDTILVYLNGELQSTEDYNYDAENKSLTFSLPLTAADHVGVLAYSTGEVYTLDRYVGSYRQKYSTSVVETQSIEIELDRMASDVPLLNVFVGGILYPDSEYEAELSSDHTALTLTFSEEISGDIDVLIDHNYLVQTKTSGIENAFVFENYQIGYNDLSPIGNWYLKSNRGAKLSPAYIKWDELDNEFKFSPGTKNREYKFAKVVFGTEFPDLDEDEEAMFINKESKKQYVFFGGKWYSTGELTEV